MTKRNGFVQRHFRAGSEAWPARRGPPVTNGNAMLKITGRGSITTCDGITRRDFLQVGTLGAIGLSLSQYAALQAMGAVAKGNDKKSAIMIFNLGAPSQLDTSDLKPNAPREIR